MEILNKILERKKFKKYEKIKNYSIIVYQDSDFEELMRLYENVFPGYISSNLWLWKNIKNPFGNFYTILMRDKNKIIGAYSNAPKDFYIYGTKYSCIQSIDIMTHRQYRGLGILTYLSKLSNEYAKHKGSYFGYGFPNNLSSSLIFNAVGWKSHDMNNLLIKDLPINIKPIKNSKDFSIIKIDKFDERINEFWEKYKKNFPIIIKKDMKYLNWRFVENPFIKYKKYLLIDENTKKIISFFILKKFRDKKGNTFGHIVDLLIGPIDKSIKKKVFKLIESYSLMEFKEDCLKISFWMPDYDLRELALKKMNYKLIPIERKLAYYIYKNIKELNILNSLKEWYITMSNSDVF